jgi:predicted PurR-regulated permease PerM
MPAAGRSPGVSAQRQALFWTSILALFILLLWLLSSILVPFVLGMAIAYFLDPVAAWLQRRRLSRTVATLVILVAFYGVGLMLVLLLAPTIFEQIVGLVQRLPTYLSTVYAMLAPAVDWMVAHVNLGADADLSKPLQAAQSLVGPLGGVLNRVFERGLAVVNLLALLSITPLVAFYLLRDWPRIVAAIDNGLPRQHADTIRTQAREIDRVLAGFARGSATVCLILALFYGVALSLVGLDFGLTIGLTAGAVSFIPYVGTIFGLSTSLGVALFQFWPDWVMVVVVLAIFLGGQVVSDYVLTPRLVGEQVGLHPLWVIFGLFAGGALFGFVGMLIAVPACAVIGVLARFTIARYKESPLYGDGEAGT